MIRNTWGVPPPAPDVPIEDAEALAFSKEEEEWRELSTSVNAEPSDGREGELSHFTF
jgi:hypothetical protein